jgi:hypothetical protein
MALGLAVVIFDQNGIMLVYAARPLQAAILQPVQAQACG